MSAMSGRQPSDARCLVCGESTELLYRAARDCHFGTAHRADYVVCSDRRCRTVAQHPRPDAATVASFYEGYYTRATLPWLKRLEKTAGGKLQAMLHRGRRAPNRCSPMTETTLARGNVALDLAGIVPGGRSPSVLDVGCGNGESLLMLRAFGYTRACGVERDEQARAAARALGLEVRDGTAEGLPFENAQFDVVFLRHVIEHVLDPARAIAEALRVLVPGGLLSLLTPNAAARNHERFGVYWRGLESPRHLQLFTPGSLATLCARAGASVLRLGTNDRSARHIASVSAARRRADGCGRVESAPFFTVDATIPRGEEIYLVAHRDDDRGRR